MLTLLLVGVRKTKHPPQGRDSDFKMIKFYLSSTIKELAVHLKCKY